MLQIETELTRGSIPHSTARHGIRGAAAMAAAFFPMLQWRFAGPSVYVHEIIGHGYLGGHLIRNYTPDQMPTYEVGAFEAFKLIGNSSGPIDFIKRIYHWQIGHLFENNMVAGWAQVSRGTPNELGIALGGRGMQAWTSLAGSLPALGGNTVAGVGGVHLKEKHPFLGYFLIAFALMDHFNNASYAWDAVFLSDLVVPARCGHDFANLAVNLGSILKCNPRLIAIAAALLYTSITPLAMMLAELRIRSRTEELVSKEAAVAWIIEEGQHQETIEKLLAAYPRKTMVNHSDLEKQLYYNYLGETLPQRMIQKARKAILTKYPARRSGRNHLSLASGAVSVASRISSILSAKSFPRLAKLSSALSYASPILKFVSIVYVLKEGVDDFRDLHTPTTIKVISASKAILVTLSSVGLFLTRRLSLYSLSFAGTMIAPIILDYTKYRAIKRTFSVQKA